MSEHGACPYRGIEREPKSAAIASANLAAKPGATHLTAFADVRGKLRDRASLQDIEVFRESLTADPDKTPVIFLDGDPHRKRRSQIARFFTPKAIAERYRKVMRDSTDRIMVDLRRTGRGQLDRMSMRLASDAVAAIVGLTESNPQKIADRMRLTFAKTGFDVTKPVGKIVNRALKTYKALTFFWFDVKPAIRARRKQRQDDVISLLLDQGYSDEAILTECMTYATAGVLTTREFIVMAAWYLFDDENLRAHFLSGTEDDQFAVLEEILRLEPVANHIFRKAASSENDATSQCEHFVLDLRAANLDEAAVGERPLAVDPSRAKRQGESAAWVSFGDGAHRCPGAQVALAETRIFLDALFRVPGIRLAVPPSVEWGAVIDTYELHGAIVECDKAI